MGRRIHDLMTNLQATTRFKGHWHDHQACSAAGRHKDTGVSFAVGDTRLTTAFFADHFGFQVDLLPGGAGPLVRVGDQALALFPAATGPTVRRSSASSHDEINDAVLDGEFMYVAPGSRRPVPIPARVLDVVDGHVFG